MTMGSYRMNQRWKHLAKWWPWFENVTNLCNLEQIKYNECIFNIIVIFQFYDQTFSEHTMYLLSVPFSKYEYSTL